MSKHSPAPFVVEYSACEDQHGNEIPSFRIYDAEGDRVAETDSGKPRSQQEADADLMAQAPGLLAALEIAASALKPEYDKYDAEQWHDAEQRDAYIKARDAIAKVRAHQ